MKLLLISPLIFIFSLLTTPAYPSDPCRNEVEESVKKAGPDEIDMYRAGREAYEECMMSSTSSGKTTGDYIKGLFGLAILLGVGYIAVVFIRAFIKDILSGTGNKNEGSGGNRQQPAYTEEMVAEIVAMYKSVHNEPYERRKEMIEEIAKKFNKTPRSIMVKLSMEDVLVPPHLKEKL